MASLPALPRRSWDYYLEPWFGIAVVSGASMLLVGQTTAAADRAFLWHDDESTWAANAAVIVIHTAAALAAFCVAYLLFGCNGEIKRSASTCLPIPEEVSQHLSDPGDVRRLKNIDGPGGSSYCVRCFVWRPGPADGGPGHHCSTCQ